MEKICTTQLTFKNQVKSITKRASLLSKLAITPVDASELMQSNNEVFTFDFRRKY